MENNDEIIAILQEIQRDMRALGAKKLMPEEPVATEIEIEAKPVDTIEGELEDAVSMGEDTEAPMVEEEEEVLPRWKQRMKKGL